MKKPVVVESYDEIVFPDPSESFLARVQNHPALTFPRLPSGYNLPAPSMIFFLSKLLAFFKFRLLIIAFKVSSHTTNSSMLIYSAS